MSKIKISSGSSLENPIGFSRAVRIGNIIAVSGTAPLAADGTTVHRGDMYRQTLRCLEIMAEAIKRAEGNLEDTIRTRIYLADMDSWQQAAKAHGEFFGN